MYFPLQADAPKTNGTPTGPALDALLDRLAKHPEQRLQVLQSLLGEAACRQLGLCTVPAGFLLSVVIPVYNERTWIRTVVERVQAVPIPKEIIIVDDCSTDGTRDILRTLESDRVRVVYQPVNRGKGAALREGFRHAQGNVIL